MRPGDELRTTCTFRSTFKDKTVQFGQGTQDEMCYAFITYYPAQRIRAGFCMNWKSIYRCRRYLPKFKGLIGSCEWKQLLNSNDPVTQKLYTNVQKQCPNYETYRQCSSNCSKVAAMAVQHPCLKEDDIGDYTRFRLSWHQAGKVLVDLLDKCANYVSHGNSIYANNIMYVIFGALLLNIYVCLAA